MSLGLNSSDSRSIFVTLVTTCDAHQRSQELVDIVEKHNEWLYLDEMVLKEVPGLYAEALFALGRNVEALHVAAHTAERLLSLPDARLETVIVTLFNLGVLQQSCGHIDESIRTMTRAVGLATSSSTSNSNPNSSSPSTSTLPHSSESSPSISVHSNISTTKRVSDEVIAALNSFLGTTLLRLNRKTDAITYLTAAVDSRERMLRTNSQDEELRNGFVQTIEALSAAHLELDDSENSRLTWERASLVLEYGGDTSGWVMSEVQKSKQEMEKTAVSPSELAGVHHRHAKALIACNTLDSLKDSLKLLKTASDTYRTLGDRHALLDSLEDLANAYEALAYKLNGDADIPSNSFVDEQVAVFGECLALGESLNGAFNLDNARYLCNLAIFTSTRGEVDRAKDLVKAALYICQKNKVEDEEEIYARAQTLMLMLSSAEHTAVSAAAAGNTASSDKIKSSTRSRGDRIKTGKM